MLSIFICHFLPGARRRRRAAAEASVLAVIEASHGGLSAMQIQEATGIGIGVLYLVLDELEESGKISGVWMNEPYPRRRIYMKR